MYKDPLLFTQPYSPQPDPMTQLEEEKRKLEDKMAMLRQTGPQQQVRPQAPVWDEIDAIVSGLSDQEMQFLNSNQEFHFAARIPPHHATGSRSYERRKAGFGKPSYPDKETT